MNNSRFLDVLENGVILAILENGVICLYFHWATYDQSDCFCPVCHTHLQTISLIDITNSSPHRDLSLLISHPVMSNSLPPHVLQHTKPPCLSPFPEVCPSSCPLHPWYHPAISSSDALLLMLGKMVKARWEGDDRGWDGWMASPTQWTWVWVDSGSWWWDRVAWCAAVHGVTNRRTRLSNWTELNN